MRFRFCGGLEPPEWLVAETPLLSRMESEIVVTICEHLAVDLSADSTGFMAERDDTKKTFPDSADAKVRDEEKTWAVLCTGVKALTRGAIGSHKKAAVAMIKFILEQSAKYDISDRELAVELRQLGIPAEVCDGIALVYQQQRPHLRKQLGAWAFKFPTIENMKHRIFVEPSTGEQMVEIHLQLDDPVLHCRPTRGQGEGRGRVLAFTVSKDKFLAMHEDLLHGHTTLQSLGTR